MPTGANCPLCQDGQLFRIRRKLWMRLFPGSKRFQCKHCSATFFLVFGSLYNLKGKNPGTPIEA
jgi:transposase-like protein